MSENESATMAPEAPAPAAKPTRRRSTSVKAKAPAEKAQPAKAAEAKPASEPKADAPAPAQRPARQPRKSVKAGGQSAPQQQGGNTAKRPGQNSSGRNQGQGNQNRQKQNGGQRQNNAGNKQGGSNQNNRRQRRPHENNRGPREMQPSVSREELAKLKVAELREKAAELNVDVTGLKKAELVEAVFKASVKAEGFIEVSGILDILADGYGFLRTQGYLPSESDCYVGLSTIRRNGLRKGDLVAGQTRPARENEKYAAIQKVTAVNGTPVEELGARVRFGDLTPVYPDECLIMEHGKNTITARVIDLVSPIGKGQRGLIVSPPKAGKTTILKDIAAAISANNPEVHLMCLLVDERPEEVTDMERSIKGEVISSTFDMPTENHIAVSELVIERAKRLVECGKDVVVLLDSLTRLARAYNLAQPASGRILSGGVDSTALYPPKRFLGAARNIEHGGSLTILASALVDTGSKMDEVIFEEFKGTGNMELKLDRNLADRRIFPAIDPVASGTRKEDLLLEPQEAPLIWAVRRILANTNNTERAMDMLIKSLKQTDTNQEFLVRTAKKAQHSKADGSIEF
ncbi:transcription termination factor Rho [Arabiibacter massiliensis]|uniref:transcription termination factor Rho n=1 Tax=Arabiibacter massiliensis TaxID=1870985 RepID=UPI0009BB6954|nr:transcription termination factor Rho [Arabiibacter massiliensis]